MGVRLLWHRKLTLLPVLADIYAGPSLFDGMLIGTLWSSADHWLFIKRVFQCNLFQI